MKNFTKEFITSVITVILAILAIGLFISSGATLIFDVVVAAAVIVGFYNAWLISVLEESPSGKGLKGRKR